MHMSPRERSALLQANVGLYPDFFSYLRAYKYAFKALIKATEDENCSVDLMSFPILFIARHALEIGLKANIRYLVKYTNSSLGFTKLSNCHDISKLMIEFQDQLNLALRIIKEKHQIEIEQTTQAQMGNLLTCLKQLIDGCNNFKGLGLIDNKSISFRYPTDRDNQPSIDPFEVISLVKVEELFDQAIVLLEYTPSVLGEYITSVRSDW